MFVFGSYKRQNGRTYGVKIFVVTHSDQVGGRVGPVELVINMTILEVIEIHLFKEINRANF